MTLEESSENMMAENETLDTDTAELVSSINYLAYGVVANVIVSVGIIGNVLNLIVLSRPKLKGVMYVYLLGLAVSNLCVLITAIPALMDIAGSMPDQRSFPAAFFQVKLFIHFFVCLQMMVNILQFVLFVVRENNLS